MTGPFAKIVTPNGVTLILDGQTHVLTQESHPNYDAIREACKTDNVGAIRKLLDLTSAFDDVMAGRVTVQHGVVALDGVQMHNTITDRILTQHKEGFDATPMCMFLANLHDNSSNRAVNELYGFLEATDLPISDDGHVIGYRMVADDYTSFHANPDGSFNTNKIGDVVEMPRNQVDERSDVTCSTGLHFCSQDYLPMYYSHGRVMVVKVNPRDVVSIPADYNNSKARCCRYEVIGEIDKMAANRDHTFGTSVLEADRVGNSSGILDDVEIRPFDGQYVSLDVAGMWFYCDEDYIPDLIEDGEIEGAVVDGQQVLVWRTRYEDEFDCVLPTVNATESGNFTGTIEQVAHELGITVSAAKKRANRGVTVKPAWDNENRRGCFEILSKDHQVAVVTTNPVIGAMT